MHDGHLQNPVIHGKRNTNTIILNYMIVKLDIKNSVPP